MTRMNSARLLWPVISLFLTLSLVAHSQSPLGTVGAEVPDQIGVYTVQVTDTSTVKPGDIVLLKRGDAKLGEATILRVQGRTLTISLKGVFEAQNGDDVFFARSPKGPSRVNRATATRETESTEELCPSCSQVLVPQEETKQMGESLMRRYKCPGRHVVWLRIGDANTRVETVAPGADAPSNVACAVCSREARFQRKIKHDYGKKMYLFRCPMDHSFWAVGSGDSGPQKSKGCPVCGEFLKPSGAHPQGGIIWKCARGHEVLK